VLRLQRGVGAARWGFFLRAETMHGFFAYLEENPGRREPSFHEVSHGESFLAVLAALPGATIIEAGPWGLRRTTWEELELVKHWKAYLDAPDRYLRHVLED
jgi:predicted ATPase